MIPLHRLLIGTAIAFCAGFALWAGWRGSPVLAGVFALLALGLAYYLRHLRRFLRR